MFRRTCILGVILVLAVFIIKNIVVFLSGIKLAEFNPAGVVFILDISNPDRSLLEREEKTILKICKSLDIEDKSKIYVLNDNAVLIYNEAPNKKSAIKKAFEEHSRYDQNSQGAAYGLALKKAVDDSLNMKKQGYKPNIVILGGLENKGALEKQINWEKLPQNMGNTMKYIPDLSIVLLYATPKKLENSREKLKNVMPEEQLFFASEENVDITVDRFIQSIGR